jgi:cell division transport system permease protein
VIRYPLKSAFQSLWNEKWINILSALSIAMGLLVLTLIAISLYNIDHFTRHLPERFSLVAYLKDGLGEGETQHLISAIKGHGSVEKVTYISKADALNELKKSLKDADYILEGLGENPLPASVEIRLKSNVVGPETVRSFAAEIKKMSGVEEVQYGEKFLLSLHSLKVGMETAGLVLAVIMTTGLVFIFYSTVKVLFYRKKEEIATLKLLGATRGFIRMPFVIEGGAIGMAGGIVSLALLILFYYGVFYRLSGFIPLLRSIVIPFDLFMLPPLAGLFLGISGALIAVGRIIFEP